MAASYKKLFKLLIDREMKSKELAAKAGISPATLAKMKKDGATVSSDVLVKICTALECTLDDIVEIVPNEANGENYGNVSPFEQCTRGDKRLKELLKLVAKNREGGLGEIKMQWRPQYHDWLPAGDIYPQDEGGEAGPQFEQTNF